MKEPTQEWSSTTSKIGWDVAGIYPPNVDGSHINTVCKKSGQALLATGDDSGLVKLFRYPAL
jgi:hypothetical protein